MRSVRSQRPRVIQVMMAAVVAASVGGMFGCSAEPSDIDWPDDPPARSAPPSSSPTQDPEEAAAIEEILALVEEFRSVEAASYVDPQPPHVARPILQEYLADPLLSEVLINLHNMQQAGVIFQGEPISEPSVVDLRLDETPQTATVRDCMNESSWQSVFRETGDPVPGDERPDRYASRLKVKRYSEGWLVYDSDVEEGPPC